MILGAVLGSVLVCAPPATPCPPLDHASLTARLGAEGPTTVVFFATWCAPCGEHLRRGLPAGAWILGVFDERERVERALGRLGIARRCAMADDTATRLGLKHLPARYTVRDGQWVPELTPAATR
ncbi:MAG TPA: hypothetical protein VFH51_11240 [Myxococcota bacterium]|nr:hypothetical protein [Myxococcota bacterium]